MKTADIPTSIISQVVSPIPCGQIIVLTNPQTGITPANILMMEFIFSLAKKYKQHHIVHALPVDSPSLWGCCAGKAETRLGAKIGVSDKESLVEMLCELWGLDYLEVCKTLVIGKRYLDQSFTLGGECHPIWVSPKNLDEEFFFEKGDSGMLQMLQTATKPKVLADIRSLLQDNFNRNLGITGSDLMRIFEEESNRIRESYELHIEINDGKEGFNHNYEWVKKLQCEISLIDKSGTKHSLALEAQQVALYLTFILFKDGIRLIDLGKDDVYLIFEAICKKLPRINNIPDKETFAKNSVGKRNKIKKAITDIIKDDNYLINQFSIEGYEGQEYKVVAATDEQRDLIRKAFEIE